MSRFSSCNRLSFTRNLIFMLASALTGRFPNCILLEKILSTQEEVEVEIIEIKVEAEIKVEV